MITFSIEKEYMIVMCIDPNATQSRQWTSITTFLNLPYFFITFKKIQIACITEFSKWDRGCKVLILFAS